MTFITNCFWQLWCCFWSTQNFLPFSFRIGFVCSLLILIWFSLHIYILFKISDKLWIYESKTNSVAETNETNGINFKSPNQKQEKVKWKEKWEKCDFGCWKPTLAYFLLQAIWVFTFFHSIEVEFIAWNKTKHLKQLSFVFQAHSIVSTYWLYKRVWFKGWKLDLWTKICFSFYQLALIPHKKLTFISNDIWFRGDFRFRT